MTRALVLLFAVVAVFATASCRVSTELEAQVDYGPTAGFVTARMNDLSLIGMEQDCLIAGLETAGAPLLTDPGSPLPEAEAATVATVLIECDALRAYIENVNQLGLGPGLNDAERECLRQELILSSSESFEALITAELMGEAGVVRSVTEFDNVYSDTWDAADACGLDF